MSLINKMLQDLEMRHASADGMVLAHNVRALPVPAAWVWPRAGLLLGVIAVTSGGTWLAFNWDRAEILRVVAPVSQAAQPRTATGPIASPAQHKTVTEVEGVQPILQHTVLEAMLPAVELSLKMESSPPVIAIPVGAPAMPSIATPPKAVAQAAAAEKSTVEKSADSSHVPKGAIERQERPATASPRQRAEQEYRKAQTQISQGQTGEAVATLRGALQEDPSHVPIRDALVNVLLAQHRLVEAQTVLKDVIVLQPGQSYWIMRLARVQVEQGDLKTAAETLQKGTTSGANNADYRALHGAVLQRTGQHAGAIAEYQAALRLAPHSGVWWMGLGLSLEADNRASEARDAFQRARSTRSLSPELERFVDGKIR